MARKRRNPPFDTFRSRVAISGVVVDRVSHDPVAGARVLLSDHPDAVPKDRTTVHTSAAGHFVFTDLPRGTYELTALVPGGGSRWGAVEQKVRLKSAHGDVQHVTVRLELPSTCVEGVVRDSQGAAVRGAVVTGPTGERTTTDAKGRFVLAALEVGTAQVAVSAPGFGVTNVDVAARAAGEKAMTEVELRAVGH